MGKWKTVIGGAACGIVAVVALPVFGAVGAITATGVLIGASFGRGMSLMAGTDDVAAAEARGEARGHSKAQAAYDLKLRAFAEQYEHATAHTIAQSHHLDVMLALIGVGMACAGARSSDTEVALAVKEFACGQAMAFLPQTVLNAIDRLVINPPNLTSAYRRAGKVAPDDMVLFDEMVRLVASTSQAAAWQQLRAAA